MLSRVRNKLMASPGRSLLAMLTLSLLCHVLVGELIGTHLRLPDLEIEMQVPIDVELGLTEAVEAAPVAPAANQELPEELDKAKPGAGRDAGVDAGLADAGTDGGADDAALADAGHQDAESPDAGSGALQDAGAPGARIPPGAQIALRVDMSRIRNSAVVEDVRSLLAAIPDWNALLAGSGIDPVNQLDRLLIATPNLQRDKVVVAGRYLGGREIVLGAVRSLAEARGVDAKWRSVRGTQVAPWANDDVTPRVIAMVGPSHFTISREEDLERVLAIAAARAKKKAGVSPADALLSMEDQEGLSLEVDGAEQFVRRARRGIPQKLRVSAIERHGTHVELRARFAYAEPSAAADALDFWRGARDRYASNALVALLGLSQVLEAATLEQQESEVHIQLVLSVEQTRLILGYLRELLPKGAPSP